MQQTKRFSIYFATPGGSGILIEGDTKQEMAKSFSDYLLTELENNAECDNFTLELSFDYDKYKRDND